MRLFSDDFFATVSLACGPPARVPDGWSRETKSAFVALVKEHFASTRTGFPYDERDQNIVIQQVYEYYYDWATKREQGVV